MKENNKKFNSDDIIEGYIWEAYEAYRKLTTWKQKS